MSALAIVALIAGVGAVGYVGYDIYKSATAPSGLQKIASSVKGAGRSIVAGATSGAASVLSDIESIF